MFYQCKRCEFKTKLIGDMERHINRKYICKTKDDYNLNNEQWKKDCLEKKYENIGNILNSINNNINNTNNLVNNIKDNLDINNKETNEIDNKCLYCNKNFINVYLLSRHNKTCKNKKIYEENIKNTDNNLKNSVENINNIQTTNIQNNTNVQNNIQNNIIINIPEKNFEQNSVNTILIPFFEKFDTSHINDNTQLILLFSNLFTTTLQEILKNDVNLNFSIDIKNKESYVYKNDDEKLVKIDNIIIYNNVWKKIRDYLLESLEKIQKENPTISAAPFDLAKKQINSRYNDLILDNEHDKVNTIKQGIKEVYNLNKEKTLQKFELIKNNLIENNHI